MKKKNVKRYLLWVLMAALVAVLAVMPLLAAQEEEETGPKASVLSASVETNNIEVSLKGGGTLSAGNAMDVKIPSGVKITKFLVRNGDAVREGDPVAKVDRVSVMNAIVAVKDSMDYIQDQINDSKNDTVSAYIRAAAGGRIKQVFAQKGDSVMDVMLEHGALAVLSLDGRMAVEVEQKTALAAGDSVLVELADGKEVTGRVESNLVGKLVVTVEDKGYAVGETVKLTTEEGDQIGSGELYVHNAWAATGYSGTIQTVNAKEESVVSEGNTLFMLTDTEYSGNVDHYSALHREYEQLLQDLFVMYETEVLTAPCDGIVSGVDEESAFLLSAPDGEEGWFVDLLSTNTTGEQDKGWTVMLLSNADAPTCTGEDREGNCKAKKHKDKCAMHCSNGDFCVDYKDKEHKNTCPYLCSSAEEIGICKAPYHKKNCIQFCIAGTKEEECQATGAHKPGCIESCEKSDGTKDCPATDVHWTDCLECCDKTENCTATKHHYPECLTLCDETQSCPAQNHKDTCYMTGLTYKAWAGRVQEGGVGTEALILTADLVPRYTLQNGKNGLELVEPTSVDTKLMLTTNHEQAVADASSYEVGDVLLFWTAYRDGTAVKSGQMLYSRGTGTPGGTQGGIPGLGGFGGFGGFGGLGGFGGMMIGGGASGTGEQQLYNLDGDVLMTVTDHSVMKLSITLDEQDITKVHVGQTAQVKVTALKSEVFEAEVTDIGMEGTGKGGSSKFAVELTLPWQENMLGGMNATAVIPLHTKMDVLTVPVAALVEEKGRTVVYTALDSETGEPASAVEITTGISDGQNVEILSGLQLGDTVYYSYYDILELDHTAKASGIFG